MAAFYVVLPNTKLRKVHKHKMDINQILIRPFLIYQTSCGAVKKGQVGRIRYNHEVYQLFEVSSTSLTTERASSKKRATGEPTEKVGKSPLEWKVLLLNQSKRDMY